MAVRTDLEQAVMRTILWFSQFSYPLTVFELWKWLLLPERAYGLAEVYAILEKSDWLKEKLESQGGFYALKGSGIQTLVTLRQDHFLDAERKFRVLTRTAKFFRLLPAVRSVGVGNTMAWWSTNTHSDIDLFIITKPGLIWSSRFWLVLPFLLLGRRPSHGQDGHGGEDPFCFSFFATSECLGMEDLCLSRDQYMAYWVRSLVPIFDRDGHLLTLQKENRWVTRTLPNAQARAAHHRHIPTRLPSLPVQGKMIEPVFRSIQRKRLPKTLRDLANLDSRVIVADSMLKFHENDRRAEFRDTYEALLERHL